MNSNQTHSAWEGAVTWLREQADQQQLVLDAFYDDPLIDAASRYAGSPEWRAVSSLLRDRSGEALDVGAGRGIASYALAREGFSVTALEPDPSSIVGAAAIRALAEESSLAINVVEEFSEQLPFSDGTFDVVFARAVLHHMRDLELGCGELHRVLKPGGLLIAVREHVITADQDLDQFLQKHPLHRLYGGEHAYKLKRYISALRSAKFASIDVLTPLGSPINLYPHTFESLREAIGTRFPQGISRRLAMAALRSDALFRCTLAVAARFDNRPGRLYSFVAHKALS